MVDWQAYSGLQEGHQQRRSLLPFYLIISFLCLCFELFPHWFHPCSLPDHLLPRLSETRLYCNTQVDIEASWGQDKTTSITTTSTTPPQPTTTGLSTAAQQQQQQQPTNISQHQEQQTATTNTGARDLESQLSQILHQSEAAPPPPSMAMTDSSLREVLNSWHTGP